MQLPPHVRPSKTGKGYVVDTPEGPKPWNVGDPIGPPDPFAALRDPQGFMVSDDGVSYAAPGAAPPPFDWLKDTAEQVRRAADELLGPGGWDKVRARFMDRNDDLQEAQRDAHRAQLEHLLTMILQQLQELVQRARLVPSP